MKTGSTIVVAAGRLARVVSRGIAPALALLLAQSCGNSSEGEPYREDPALEEERRAFLKAYAKKVVVPLYADVETLSGELLTTLEAHDKELTSESLLAAQAAWKELISLWQRAELMQVGPTAPLQYYPESGEDLRDEIYSWPFGNPCRVDQQLVEAGYADLSLLREAGPNSYGLDALEYLLFHVEDSNSCSALASINEEGTWDELVAAEELAAARAAYALSVGRLLQDDIAHLLARWRDDDDAFVNQLSRAGESGLYGTAREALNAVTDGLFYIETEAKDLKLAVPSGISDNCSEDTCPEARESLFANISVPHLKSNLEGFQAVYLGPAGAEQGLEDLLLNAGEVDITEELRSRLDFAFEALEDIDDPTMVEALRDDPERVRDAHAAFRAVVDVFRGELVEALSLSVPDRAAGDND